MRRLLLVVAMLLCGCTDERSEGKTTTDGQTDRTEVVTVTGTVGLPFADVVVPLPVDLRIERTVSETRTQVAQSQNRTTKQLDAGAIAQQLGGALGKALDVALAKATGGLLGGHASSGLGWFGTPEGQLVGGGGLGTAVALAIQQTLAARRNRKDSDEAWDEIKQRSRRALPTEPTPEKATS